MDFPKLSDLDYKYIYGIPNLIEIKQLFVERIDLINKCKDILEANQERSDNINFDFFSTLSLDGITQLDRLIDKKDVESSEQFLVVYNTINIINANISKNIHKSFSKYKKHKKIGQNVNEIIKKCKTINFKLDNSNPLEKFINRHSTSLLIFCFFVISASLFVDYYFERTIVAFIFGCIFLLLGTIMILLSNSIYTINKFFDIDTYNRIIEDNSYISLHNNNKSYEKINLCIDTLNKLRK